MAKNPTRDTILHFENINIRYTLKGRELKTEKTTLRILKPLQSKFQASRYISGEMGPRPKRGWQKWHRK